MVKSRHPEVYRHQPLKVHMEVCDQCQELAPQVITNIITFFASGGMFLRSYHMEKLMRMVPPGIKGFRVELFVAVFSKIVRGPARSVYPCPLPQCLLL